MGHPHVQRRHAAIHKFLIILSPHLPRKYPEFLTSCPCTRRRNTHKLLTKPSPRLPRKYSTSFRHTIPALAADNSKHLSLHRELGDSRLLLLSFWTISLKMTRLSTSIATIFPFNKSSARIQVLL